jgi:hypothetical protein
VSSSPIESLRLDHGWTAAPRGHPARELTFIQVARHFAFDGRSLDLLDLAPVTVCIGPAPTRTLGHLTTGAFLDLWSSSFDGDAPRPAVISLANQGISPWFDTTVELDAPRIHDSGLRYDVACAEGVLPADSGSAVLFIAPAPVLASPGSDDAWTERQSQART